MDESQSQGPAPSRVSVLILSYNTADSLRRCLNALERSEPREQLEIIVMDNGSQDESPRLENEFPGATFLKLPRNFGATKALNIGMRTAAGQYIFFLSPEIEVEPKTASALATRLDADESVVAACPLIVSPAGEPLPQSWRLPRPDSLGAYWRNPESLPAVAVDLNADSCAIEYPDRRAVMVRKFFIKALNYLDERYGEFGWALEFAQQARRSQRKILAIPGVRVVAHPPEQIDFSPSQRALLSADRAAGLARFAAKHYGFAAGFKLRAGAVMHTFGQLLAMRQPGYQVNRLTALISGQKIDGSQSSL
jgi:glycosyltransferase involved in cell wall biosynthesis